MKSGSELENVTILSQDSEERRRKKRKLDNGSEQASSSMQGSMVRAFLLPNALSLVPDSFARCHFSPRGRILVA